MATTGVVGRCSVIRGLVFFYFTDRGGRDTGPFSVEIQMEAVKHRVTRSQSCMAQQLCGWRLWNKNRQNWRPMSTLHGQEVLVSDGTGIEIGGIDGLHKMNAADISAIEPAISGWKEADYYYREIEH